MLSFEDRESKRTAFLSFYDKTFGLDKESWFLTFYSDLYLMSNTGKVKNILTGKILKPTVTSHGYESVRIRNDKGELFSFTMHRLVAQTLLQLQDFANYEVNHLDGNKLNNNIKNLQWVTRQENLSHARENGLFKSLKREDSPSLKYSDELIDVWIDLKKECTFNQLFELTNVPITYMCTLMKRRKSELAKKVL